MSPFTVLVVCIQACLIQSTLSCSCSCGGDSRSIGYSVPSISCSVPSISFSSPSISCESTIGSYSGSNILSNVVSDSGCSCGGGSSSILTSVPSISCSVPSISYSSPSISYGSGIGSISGSSILSNVVSDSGCSCGSGSRSIGYSVPSISYNSPSISYGSGVSSISSSRSNVVSNSRGSYGGTGPGIVSASGEIGAYGDVEIVGAVPVLGEVSFSGCTPAYGSVSLCGQCGCGCV